MALGWLSLLALLPLCAAIPAGEGRLLRITVALVAVVLALPALRRDLLRRGDRAVLGLAWDESGFTLRCASGEREPVRLCHGSLRAGRFAWLMFEGRRRHRVFVDGRDVAHEEAASLWRALRREGRRGSDLR